MKKLTLLATLIGIICSTDAALAFDYTLEGTGAARSGYEACNQSLADFEKMLQKTFVEVLEKPKCIQNPELKDTFLPQFKVLAQKPYITRKIAGAPFSSLSFCEIELQRLIKENSRKHPVLEGNCIDQKADSLFKPEVVLLISEGI